MRYKQDGNRYTRPDKWELFIERREKVYESASVKVLKSQLLYIVLENCRCNKKQQVL